jgi:diguanylate cyclase (GGDEF)-like protein
MFIENTYPNTITHYTSNSIRTLDLGLSFFIITAFIFVVLRKIMKEYTDTIEELETAKNKLRVISNTDELSGIYNRRYLLNRLEHNLLNSSNNISVIMFDIDDFKKINDTYGHTAGDEIIKKISWIFTNNIRSKDIVGRIGGEEFLIVLDDSNYNSAKLKAEHLRTLVANHKWSFENLKVTISGGVYSKKNADTIEDILKKVDVYLYKSKNNGKNRIN